MGCCKQERRIRCRISTARADGGSPERAAPSGTQCCLDPGPPAASAPTAPLHVAALAVTQALTVTHTRATFDFTAKTHSDITCKSTKLMLSATCKPESAWGAPARGTPRTCIHVQSVLCGHAHRGHSAGARWECPLWTAMHTGVSGRVGAHVGCRLLRTRGLFSPAPESCPPSRTPTAREETHVLGHPPNSLGLSSTLQKRTLRHREVRQAPQPGCGSRPSHVAPVCGPGPPLSGAQTQPHIRKCAQYLLEVFALFSVLLLVLPFLLLLFLLFLLFLLLFLPLLFLLLLLLLFFRQ